MQQKMKLTRMLRFYTAYINFSENFFTPKTGSRIFFKSILIHDFNLHRKQNRSSTHLNTYLSQKTLSRELIGLRFKYLTYPRYLISRACTVFLNKKSSQMMSMAYNKKQFFFLNYLITFYLLLNY